MLCLSALVVRGMQESALALAVSPEDTERFSELVRRLNNWLNEQDFTALFTVGELDDLSATPGTWNESQHQAQAERVEGLGILRWALGLEDVVPGYDQPFPLPDLNEVIGWPADAVTSATETFDNFPYNSASLLASLAYLRPPASLIAQRNAADCWQWRLNMARHQHANPTPAAGHDYGMLIGIAAEEAHAAGAIGRPVQNDFPVKGRPFRVLPADVQEQCGRITAWRHVALDWLCGYATAWDDLPVAQAA